MMKSTSFQKSAGRAVKGSLARFLSIAVISFLGAGVFAGLAAVSPDMKQAGDAYYDAQNVMDVRMLSAYGFGGEDVQAIRGAEGVSGVMASNFVDATGTVGDKDYSFRLNGLPESADPADADNINQLKLISGRRPQSKNEAIIVRPSIGLKNITLGSTVSLNKNSNSALTDTVDLTEYKIVGIAESPYYLSFMQGNTSVGNGVLNYILYIPQKNFIADGYTDLYVTVKGAKGLNAFGSGYFDCTDAAVKRLEALAGKRQTLRRDQLRSDLADADKQYKDAEKETKEKLADAEAKLDGGARTLADAKKQYADGLAEYNRQKADADRQLADAKAKLNGGAQTLADAKKKYTDGLAEYGRQKTEAGRQLSGAKAKLDDGAQALADAKKQYADGLAEYDRQKADADRQLADAEGQLGAAAAQISAGENELAGKQSEFQASQASLEAARAQLDSGWSGYNGQADSLAQQEAYLESIKDTLTPEAYAAAKSQIDQGQAQLAAVRQTLESGEAEYAANSAALGSARTQLSEGSSKLASAKQDYRKGLEEYDARKAEAETKLSAAKVQLDGAAAKIADGEAGLAAKQREYGEKETEADTKLAAAKAELDGAAAKIRGGETGLAAERSEYNGKKAEAGRKFADAETKLGDAASKIADGENELAQKRREYDSQKAEADTKLADAKQKIENGEKKLSGLGEPKWYVLDRDRNESFVNYEDDTSRMHDLATVFPLIFFLVAALVCLTTMTRMVDEDRTLIGTFEALGYSNARIAGRYLKYAASASLIGSIAGVLLGFWLLPTIIWGAYGIVFALPEMTPAFYPGIAAASIFATVFIITLSTGIAAKKSLLEPPAELMRPKAPKSGKRVFLEYVKPVWSRLSFTKKVTVRNLGLNKKRLTMTLIGILGCTALVVTAFGAKNAVNTILNGQFGGILHYDLSVGFNGKEPSPQLTSLLSNGAYFEKSTQVLYKSAEASPKSGGDDAYNVYVVSPEDAKKLTDYITLSDPKGKPLPFGEGSAVITEKLAMDLHADVGDTILVKYLDEDQRHAVRVTGITKNYALNFVYLGKTAYRQAFGADPEYNQFFVIRSDGHTSDQIKTYLSPAPDVGVISFTDDLMGNIRTSINSVDNIIWILIISAGLLAFVVLYNLTNINVGERQRELATLKVLGFYDKETYSHIFRETWILSVVGCLLGLFGGVFLYRAVIATVEPDMILLTRDLTWQGYLGAAALTMFFTWVVDQCMKPRIKNIDMLESLKSVD